MQPGQEIKRRLNRSPGGEPKGAGRRCRLSAPTTAKHAADITRGQPDKSAVFLQKRRALVGTADKIKKQALLPAFAEPTYKPGSV